MPDAIAETPLTAWNQMGDVVGQSEEGACHQEGEHAGSPDTASCYHMWRHHCIMRTPETALRRKPVIRNAEDHEDGDDPAVLPMGISNHPLQRKEKGDDGWHQEHVPVEIEGLEAVSTHPMLATASRLGVVEQEHDGHNIDCSKWEINVEA